MKHFKLILFDMGNVLLTFNPMYILSILCKEEDSLAVLSQLFESQTWLDLDAGQHSQADALKIFKAQYPWHDQDCIEKIFNQWHHHMLPIEGMDSLIKDLKGKGHRIILASNASDRYHEYLDEYPILKQLDQRYYSCDLKRMKPSKQFYEEILLRENKLAFEAYFIDDKLENCLAAQDLGIQSYHFNKDVGDLRVSLIREGIL